MMGHMEGYFGSNDSASGRPKELVHNTTEMLLVKDQKEGGFAGVCPWG